MAVYEDMWGRDHDIDVGGVGNWKLRGKRGCIAASGGENWGERRRDGERWGDRCFGEDTVTKSSHYISQRKQHTLLLPPLIIIVYAQHAQEKKLVKKMQQ